MLGEVVPDLTVMAPYVQWGFAGFCFVVFFTLMSVIVWLIKQLLTALKESGKVISGNTAAICSVHNTADETKRLMSDIRDQLLTRPCLMNGVKHEELARKTAESLDRVAEHAAIALNRVAAHAAEALRVKEDDTRDP